MSSGLLLSLGFSGGGKRHTAKKDLIADTGENRLGLGQMSVIEIYQQRQTGKFAC
jgi:hypothetical protein